MAALRDGAVLVFALTNAANGHLLPPFEFQHSVMDVRFMASMANHCGVVKRNFALRMVMVNFAVTRRGHRTTAIVTLKVCPLENFRPERRVHEPYVTVVLMHATKNQ